MTEVLEGVGVGLEGVGLHVQHCVEVQVALEVCRIDTRPRGEDA